MIISVNSLLHGIARCQSDVLLRIFLYLRIIFFTVLRIILTDTIGMILCPTPKHAPIKTGVNDCH